jgi:hypothetical protein
VLYPVELRVQTIGTERPYCTATMLFSSAGLFWCHLSVLVSASNLPTAWFRELGLLQLSS